MTVEEQAAAKALVAASPTTLLRSYASLTRRIQAEEIVRDQATKQTGYWRLHDRRIQSLRTQRGLVEDEILRRIGT